MLTRFAIMAARNAHYSDFRRFVARRVGDSAMAEDVFRNFCLKVVQSETELRDDTSAVGWLYTVLRLVLTDHCRKEPRRRGGDARHVQDQLVPGEENAEPDHGAGLCGCVNGPVLDLRSEYGEVLRPVDFEDESRERVGAELGVSQENLRVSGCTGHARRLANCQRDIAAVAATMSSGTVSLHSTIRHRAWAIILPRLHNALGSDFVAP